MKYVDEYRDARLLEHLLAEMSRLDINRPLKVGIDQRDVRPSPGRKGAGVDLEQFRRRDRVHLNQAREIDCAISVHEESKKQTELGFQADNAERCHVELDFFFESRVRRMIGSQNRQCPICDSFEQRFDIAIIAQRRIHFAICFEVLDRAVR